MTNETSHRIETFRCRRFPAWCAMVNTTIRKGKNVEHYIARVFFERDLHDATELAQQWARRGEK